MSNVVRRAFFFDAEVAIVLRVAPSTPRYLRFIGRLPTVKLGRRAAVPRAALLEYLAARGVPIADSELDAVLDGHRGVDGGES